MITLLSFSFFFLVSIIGYGVFFSEKILKIKTSNFGEIGILGLIFLAFIVTFFHFFFPISQNFNLLLHLIGIIFFIYNIKKISNYFAKDKIIIFLYFFSLLIFFKHKPNEDFGFYHLPYVINFTSEKLIIGLANLQIQQGWNSIWLNLHSIFYFYIINYKGIYLLNSFLFIFICSIFLNFIFQYFKNNNKKNSIIFFFALFFLSFFLIKFSKINSYGLDVPGNFILILSIFYFLKLIFLRENNSEYFKFFCLILIFSFLIRISSAPFFVLLLYIFFKNKFYKNLIFTKFFTFVIFFSFIWILQQFFYTGCFIFPYEFLCIDNLIWSDKNFILKFHDGTFLANKSFEAYKGNLSYDEYFKNFNWVPTWFFRNKIELFEYLGPFISILIFVFIFSKKKLSTLLDEEKNLNFKILLIIIFSSLLIWFVNSPSIRMGNHFFLSLLFFLFFYPPLLKKKIYLILSRKMTMLIIILAFSILSIKQFTRISQNISINFNPWPIFEKINYYEINVGGLKINKIIDGNSPQLTVCWDVKFLCARSHLDNLKVTKKYNYIILSLE